MILETNARSELRHLADQLNRQFEGASADKMLRSLARNQFEGRIGLVSSFGTEAAVLLHMVAQVDPYIPVIFLDTRKHFPETIRYRDDLAESLGLHNIQLVTPRTATLRADDPAGDLHASNTDLCCHIRKTVPMMKALRSLSCWITGRKRYQAVTRADIDRFEAQDRWIKVNPLFDWRAKDIDDYFADHKLPRHPLQAQGFASVGCQPCTRAIRPGEDPRAGRWSDSEKTECGIHLVDGKLVRK